MGFGLMWTSLTNCWSSKQENYKKTQHITEKYQCYNLCNAARKKHISPVFRFHEYLCDSDESEFRDGTNYEILHQRVG